MSTFSMLLNLPAQTIEYAFRSHFVACVEPIFTYCTTRSVVIPQSFSATNFQVLSSKSGAMSGACAWERESQD